MRELKVTIASAGEKKSRLPADKGSKKACRRKRRRRLYTRTYYYYALGDGVRRAFTLNDALPGYDSWIPDPRKMSIINVFVDGLLQEPGLYIVHSGLLLFDSDQPPPPDSRIIAQFIAIRN